MKENDRAVQVFDQQKPNRPWWKLSGREWLICMIIAIWWQYLHDGIGFGGRDLINYVERIPGSTLAYAIFWIVIKSINRAFTKPRF